MYYTPKPQLIIEWFKIPEEIRSTLDDWFMENNRGIHMMPSEYSDDAASLTMEGLKDYYEEQKRNFSGTFEDFIEDYNLHLEYWLVTESGIPFKKFPGCELMLDCNW